MQSKTKENKASDDEEDTEAYQSKYLPRGELKILKVTDLNASSRAEGHVIRSVKFHPKSPVGLVAGSSGVVSLYQVC